jgi:hypothetical protein
MNFVDNNLLDEVLTAAAQPEAISIPFATLPLNQYIRGPRISIVFPRLKESDLEGLDQLSAVGPHSLGESDEDTLHVDAEDESKPVPTLLGSLHCVDAGRSDRNQINALVADDELASVAHRHGAMTSMARLMAEDIRTKLREKSFFRRILPPLPLRNDELDRSVMTNKPVKVVDDGTH